MKKFIVIGLLALTGCNSQQTQAVNTTCNVIMAEQQASANGTLHLSAKAQQDLIALAAACIGASQVAAAKP